MYVYKYYINASPLPFRIFVELWTDNMQIGYVCMYVYIYIHAHIHTCIMTVLWHLSCVMHVCMYVCIHGIRVNPTYIMYVCREYQLKYCCNQQRIPWEAFHSRWELFPGPRLICEVLYVENSLHTVSGELYWSHFFHSDWSVVTQTEALWRIWLKPCGQDWSLWLIMPCMLQKGSPRSWPGCPIHL